VNIEAKRPGRLEEKMEARDLRLLGPEYKPGAHEVERGDVTWHQLRAPYHASGDITVRDRALEEGPE
jgi:hypothetical protein